MATASEKLAIIRLVEDSELSIRRTLKEINVSRSSFYRWYRAYERHGFEGKVPANNRSTPTLQNPSVLNSSATRHDAPHRYVLPGIFQRAPADRLWVPIHSLWPFRLMNK